MPKAAAIIEQGARQKIEFVRIPIEEVRKNSADFAIMLEWFDRVGYNADIDGVARELGFKPTKLLEAGRRSSRVPPDNRLGDSFGRQADELRMSPCGDDSGACKRPSRRCGFRG